MARCSCSGSTTGCSCRLTPGDGILIAGSGTASDPFVITSENNSFASAFVAVDTPTVDLNLVGSGTASDPFVLSANSSIGMTQLKDWDDPSGPAVGDVPVFNGSKWEAAPPPTVPPGFVNANTGITGDGTLATPLKVAVVGGSTSTSGLASYIDSAGKLRVIAPVTTAPAWGDITGKPSSYPDAAKILGHAIYVQTTAPTSGMVVDDLWVKKP